MRARLIFLALALITVVGVALLAARGDGGGPSATPQRVAAQRSAPVVKPARPSVRTRARVQLPGGSLRVKKPKLMAGADVQSLDLGVTIDRAAPGARVEVTLPQRFVGRSETGLRFAGDPRLSAD